MRLRQTFITLVTLTLLITLSTAGWAQVDSSSEELSHRVRSPNNPMIELPTEERETPLPLKKSPKAARFPDEFRTIDGFGNNPNHPDWGNAGITFLRLAPVDYADGASVPAGGDRLSPREISNIVVAQSGSIPNQAGVSDFVWQWGQFLDHDIDLTPEVDPAEHFDIEVPAGDIWFDPFNTGLATIPLNRSVFDVVNGVRQQNNLLTAFIDASNVYGSDAVRAQELRALDGTGRLKTSAGNLLPFNVNGLPNAAPAGSDPADFFLAGDFRANEQVGLTTMHTLFMREHNYWADVFRFILPNLSGDEVYQFARAIVAGEMQAITYNQFLPILLGPRALPRYRKYKSQINPGVSNTFASASYRFGHSMLSPTLLRLDANGDEIFAGHLSLANGFFNPDVIIQDGIDPLLRGLANQQAQEIDNFLVDEVRNLLFGPPGSGGLDLASLNIQRGREHGLPSYNAVRVAFGLAPMTSFADINPDPAVQANLANAYDTVDDIDAWVGGLAEPHVPGALVGETLRAVLSDQFRRLRDGDRFWYEAYLPLPLALLVKTQTLAKIIRRNTGIGHELQNNAFIAPAP